MNELSKRQVRAAQLEATGMKAIDIAHECKVTPQTISSYRHLDEYRVLVSKIASNAFKSSQMRLVNGIGKAVDTILGALDSEDEKVRLRASEGLIKMVGITNLEKLIENDTLAKLKTTEMFYSTDLGIMENVHSEADYYLDQLGLSE